MTGVQTCALPICTPADSLLPKCSDPDDQKFLELARDCGADYLVTKDKALLALARRKTRPAPCRIVTPVTMCALLQSGAGVIEGASINSA